MEKVQITVTEDHIKRGQRGSYCCPIALAFRDAGFRYISVGFVTFIDDLIYSRQGKLPPEATAFIMKYDHEGPSAVEPFTFEVFVPEVER